MPCQSCSSFPLPIVSSGEKKNQGHTHVNDQTQESQHPPHYPGLLFLFVLLFDPDNNKKKNSNHSNLFSRHSRLSVSVGGYGGIKRLFFFTITPRRSRPPSFPRAAWPAPRTWSQVPSSPPRGSWTELPRPPSRTWRWPGWSWPRRASTGRRTRPSLPRRAWSGVRPPWPPTYQRPRSLRQAWPCSRSPRSSTYRRRWRVRWSWPRAPASPAKHVSTSIHRVARHDRKQTYLL